MANPVMTAWLTEPDGLATQLTRLRVTASLTVSALAETLGLERTKVSRIGNGQLMPTADLIRAWAAACDAPRSQAEELVETLNDLTSHQLRWRAHAARGGNVQSFYNRLAETTTHTVLVETTLIPGPLQTADYARAALNYLLPLNNDAPDVEAVVAGRLARQASLRDGTKRWELYMTESVLLSGPATAPVMVAQLERLTELAELPTVTIGIVPLTTGLGVVTWNSFGIYDDEHVLVETFTAEQITSPSDIAVYRRVADDIRAAAVTGSDATATINAANTRHGADS